MKLTQSGWRIVEIKFHSDRQNTKSSILTYSRLRRKHPSNTKSSTEKNLFSPSATPYCGGRWWEGRRWWGRGSWGRWQGVEEGAGVSVSKNTSGNAVLCEVNTSSAQIVRYSLSSLSEGHSGRRNNVFASAEPFKLSLARSKLQYICTFHRLPRIRFDFQNK